MTLKSRRLKDKANIVLALIVLLCGSVYSTVPDTNAQDSSMSSNGPQVPTASQYEFTNLIKGIMNLIYSWIYPTHIADTFNAAKIMASHSQDFLSSLNSDMDGKIDLGHLMAFLSINSNILIYSAIVIASIYSVVINIIVTPKAEALEELLENLSYFSQYLQYFLRLHVDLDAPPMFRKN